MFSVIQEAACVYESTFTMTGGTISENTAEDGAGAYIYCGTFTMNGGTISKNTAEYGAGVYLEYDTFTMTGGTIAENEAGGDGGGVKVIGGTFAMTGGDIIGNSAEQGGGVRVYNGTFTMENGTITNNTATESGGGVLLNKSIERGYYTGIGKLTLSGGNPVICGNTAGQAADNTRFTETDLFTLAGSLGDNAEVRITSPDAKQYASFGTVSGTPNGAEHIILDEKNFTGAVNGSSLIWGDVTLHKHDGITFVPWTSSTKLPTSGNYHLVCDVTLTSHCALSGDLNLCLNGYVIRMNGKQSAFLVENGHTLNLYEDIPAKHYFTVSETNGVLNRDDSKTAGDIRLEDITSTADLTNGKVIEVTGGCITGSTEDGSGGGVYVNGGTFIMHQGNIIGNKPESGGGVYVRAGSFTMKSGSVAGNVATKSDGGGVYVSDNGKFVMDSGLIIGNSAKSNGGGVLVYNSAGKFTMNGGSIRANHANHGGGVWNGGEFLIPASTSLDVSSITGNGATSGGGVFVSGGGSSFTMYGGAITNNTAACYGGGVYFNGSTFDLMNGIITGNSTNGADNDSDGGGVYVNGGMFKLSGGITNIKENTKNGEANNVQLTGGTLRLAGNLWEGADIRITGPEPVPGAEFGSASDSPTGAIYIQSDDETMFGRVDGSSLVWEKRIDVPVAKISSGTEFSSVQAAVNAASSGDTVTLLTNAKSGDTITISKKEITLDLSGYVLSTTGSKPVITIGTLGILTVTDSNPDEKHYFTNASGLYVYAGDEQTGGLTEVTGGCITGGSSVNGGGVSISDGGTLTLAGGNIIGNSASDDGGGVYASGLYVGGSFVMTGGNIIGNSAKSNGGSVYVAGGSSFVMKGGSITENTGEWCCGGVYVYSGTFTMNGGSITKNNGGTYGGGVNVSYGKFIISGGNPVIKENTRGTGNQAYAANVQLSATNQLELTGTLGESAEIYVTSPDTMRGSIFGTASDTAGGAEHIISDIKIDDKPVSGIIFNTLLMWDDTEEKTDIGFGSSMSVNAPVSNDLQSAPPNDTGDLTADLRSLDYMVESVALHDVDTANPGRYKLNYKASSALWDEFNLPMMMESSLYVKPFKLEITCDGEPFDARLTVTFKVDKENVKKVITERKDVMLGHLNGNNKWELIKADMVTQVSEDDQYLHFSVTAQEPTAFFAAAVMEKPVTIPVDNGTAEFEDDGDIKVLSGCDAAYDIQLTRVTNLTNGSEVQLRESNSNPVAVTILENHLEKLLQDDPSLDSQIISVFGVRVMNSAGSEVSTGGVLTLKVVLKDGYSPEYVRFYHFETRAWALLSSEYLGGIEYSIPTRSFSPFAVVYAEPKEKPTPVPASSSSQQGSSTWLTETPTPTPAPTPTPTGTPAPEMPQVKPLETKQAASPAPFIGVLAELGCAAVVFGLRRK